MNYVMMNKMVKEIIYNEENLGKVKKMNCDWWIIHSNEHPSGKRYIGYIK